MRVIVRHVLWVILKQTFQQICHKVLKHILKFYDRFLFLFYLTFKNFDFETSICKSLNTSPSDPNLQEFGRQQKAEADVNTRYHAKI